MGKITENVLESIGGRKLCCYLPFLCILAEAERFLTGFFMSTIGIGGVIPDLAENLAAVFTNFRSVLILLLVWALR